MKAVIIQKITHTRACEYFKKKKNAFKIKKKKEKNKRKKKRVHTNK